MNKIKHMYASKNYRREQQSNMGCLATYSNNNYYTVVAYATVHKIVSIWKALKKAFSISSFSICNSVYIGDPNEY